MSPWSSDWCPYKERLTHRNGEPCEDTDTGRKQPVTTEAGTGVMHLLTKEGQGLLANTRSKEARKDSPLQVIRGSTTLMIP